METELYEGLPSAGLQVQAPVVARRAVSALFFMNGALFATWVSRIPAIQQGLGMSHGFLGLALLGMAGGALIAMPLAGRASSCYGSHRVCQVSATLYSLMLPLLALAPDKVTFMLALAAFGASHGALDVAMNAQAVLVEKQYDRPVMASFHALFSLGGLAGAGMGAGFAALEAMPLLHYMLAALLLGCGGGLVVFHHLHVEHPGEMQAGPENAAKASSGISWRQRKRLLVLGVVAFCVMIGEGAMADWSAVFLRDVVQASEGTAAAGYAAFSIAMALGRFAGDGLAAWLGPVLLVRCSGVLAVAGMGLALGAGSPVLALVGFAAVGAGFATVVPQVFSAAGSTPDVRPGPAVAAVVSLGYLGFLLGPPVIGLLAEGLGLRPALGVILLTSFLLVVLAASVGPRSPERSERIEPSPQPA
ncbi:MAG TPA: MFS transporter [Prosthecobacter sp.]